MKSYYYKIGCIGLVSLLYIASVQPSYADDVSEAIHREASLKKIENIITKDPAALEALDIRLRTPLHWVALYGRNDIVEFLLSKKVAVNLQDYEGNTALHLAALYDTRPRQRAEIIGFLIAAGARTDIRNVNGLSAIDVANGFDFRLLMMHYSVKGD